MPRGNAENLRLAAQRKRAAAIARADTALLALEHDGAVVTLETALAAAHGENLDLRRRLGRSMPAAPQ